MINAHLDNNFPCNIWTVLAIWRNIVVVFNCLQTTIEWDKEFFKKPCVIHNGEAGMLCKAECLQIYYKSDSN